MSYAEPVSPPKVSAADRTLAESVAAVIVERGAGRIRRVYLLGSRSRGLAQPDSDLDLLVVIEPNPGERWSGPESLAEQHRLRKVFSNAPVLVDIEVRTIDQFAEASGVVGAVEHRAASAGVQVYHVADTRAPNTRVKPEHVRCHVVRDWIEEACSRHERALAESRTHGSVALINGPAYVTGPGLSYQQQTQPTRRDPAYHAWQAITRAIGALAIWQGVTPGNKQDPPAAWIAILQRVDTRLAAHLGHLVAGAPRQTETATLVVAAIAAKLVGEPVLGAGLQRVAVYAERLLTTPGYRVSKPEPPGFSGKLVT